MEFIPHIMGGNLIVNRWIDRNGSVYNTTAKTCAITRIVESRLAEGISRLWHVVSPIREGRHSCRLNCKLGMFRHLCVDIERITSPMVTDLWLLVPVDLGLLPRWNNLQWKQKPTSLKILSWKTFITLGIKLQ